MAVPRTARSLPSALAALAALAALGACGGADRLQPASADGSTPEQTVGTATSGPEAATASTASTAAGEGGANVVVSGGGVVVSGGEVRIDGSVVGSGSDAVVGSGVLVTEDRALSGFRVVELRGFAVVHIARGDHDSVQVRADDNVAPLVTTEVRDGTLLVGFVAGTSLRNATVEVTVTAAALDTVRAGGSGRLDVSGLAGAPFALELSGSGDAVVTGSATDATLSVDGSGELDASGLVAERAVVRVAGSGEAAVQATAALDAAVSGSGEISYRGTPATLTTAVSGSGEIEPA
ncbi:MAG: DUF2807 domain-containing protein [Acidimicrobiales bacterium]|nr:DUF2807 domain-containing protein [Acidimicrobiales bacterium]